MRLLCLHGYGTNGDCLRGQMQPVMEALGGEHECVHLEGEAEVGQSIYTGDFDPPYLAYYEDTTAKNAKEGHELLQECIDEDGPFDGIVGFSQGAGLAMAYLLNLRITKPNEPSPFKFAMFFSTTFILSPDPDYKKDEILNILGQFSNEDISAFHRIVFNPSSQRKDLENAGFVKKLSDSDREMYTEIAWDAISVMHTRFSLDISDSTDFIEKLREDNVPLTDFPRFYNPIYTQERINIPTVHCWGRNDHEGHKRISIIGSHLCSDENMFVMNHSGGHELPIRRDEAKAVAIAIEKAFYLGQQYAIVV